MAGSNKGRIISWALFDFANTAFYVVILTVGYPLYFKEVVAGESANADFLWGLSFSVSMVLVAFLSPVLGAAADAGSGKKLYLGIFTALCIAATGGLSFVGPGMVAGSIALLVLANVGFEGGVVFYDAFLTELTTERSYGRVSGYGFAAGYAGSLITLGVVFPLYVDGFVPENLGNVRMSFLIAAGMFLLFAIPLFLVVPDQQKRHRVTLQILRQGASRLSQTLHSLGQYKNVARFLSAYFLYIDAINTIIIFSSIFARHSLGFDLTEILLFFALVQTSALIGSVVFGVLADHIGHKQSLTITLIVWLFITVTAYFVTDKTTFFVVGFFAGIALGSSQSTSRSLFTAIIPAEKRTEFFGFYSFFGKASAILGPLIFGLISSIIDQRTAILSVSVFFIGGLILLRYVDVQKPGDPGHPVGPPSIP